MIAKSVLKGEFPLTAEFRNGPRNPKPSYESWKEKQPNPDGFRVDLQTNVLRFSPGNYEYANTFAKENPNVLILSTWRAASGTPKGADDDGDPLGVSPIDFPGHFVLSPGSTLASNLARSATALIVKSGANMVKGPALLVEMDDDGNKLWDRFEYILIMSVKDASLEVKRAFNGSPPARDFPARYTTVAPMPWDGRNRAKYTDWFFNLSKYCPKDDLGRTAMDTLFQDMLDPLAVGGALEHIGGLDLASGPLTIAPSNPDYDLDGEVDKDALYWEGVEMFYQRVRKVLGPNRILMTSLDYRFLGYINGLNREGLARPDDPWEEVSRTVNEVLAWQRLSPLPMVSLAFQQHMDREEDLLRVQLQRLLNGYSACLGMASDIETGSGSEALDAIKRLELFKGNEQKAHWLGKAIGLKRPAAMTPNLLTGTSDSAADWDDMMSALSVRRGELIVDKNELVLRPTGRKGGDLTLYLNFWLDQKSDFTVFMELISDDDQAVRKINLPRVSVPVDTGPTRATFTNKDYLPLTFYVRGAHGGSVTIDFRFKDGGDVRLRSLSVHASPDTLACEFQSGVVLVNPSLEDSQFDLPTLFPGRTGFRRILASTPEDANDMPEKYIPQLTQAMELNDGSPIRFPAHMHVPQRNAIFLVADDSPFSMSNDNGPPIFIVVFLTLFGAMVGLALLIVWGYRRLVESSLSSTEHMKDTNETLDVDETVVVEDQSGHGAFLEKAVEAGV